MLIPLGFWAASGAGGGGATDFQLISTQILGTAAASVTFSAIPNNFRHLQIRMTARTNTTGSSTDQFWMQFNADTGANYGNHTLSGNGTTVSSSASWGNNQFAFGNNPQNSDTAGIFSASVADILDYAQTTKNKTLRMMNGFSGSSVKITNLNSGLWISTSAINSIKVFAGGSINYVAGSRFSLYGWN